MGGDGGGEGVAGSRARRGGAAAQFRRRGSNGAARAPERYKRPFDLALLAAAGLLLAPLWVVGWVAVALAIRLEDGGPVLYRQRRVGRGGREFEIVKFRTMAVDAERQTGPVLAREGDAHTAVGRLLRRFHVDELAQAVNVVRGEMSLVGPRPERPELAARFECEARGFARRLRVRPGIAGLAQARGSYDTRPRDKLRYDLLYLEAMGPVLDLKLLAGCLCKALCGRRARRRRIRAPRAGRRR